MSSGQSSSKVQIIIAIIGFVGVLSAALITNWDKIFLPEEDKENKIDEVTNNKDVGVSGRYTDVEGKRAIFISHLNGNQFAIEEPTGSWPWKGEAQIEGSEISGWARFPKSKASMDVKGFIRDDGSIQFSYEFITKGDGSNGEGTVHRHV